jgi:hypothetical protein
MGIEFSKQYTQQAVTQALQINLPNWASASFAQNGPATQQPWGVMKQLPSRGTQLKSNAYTVQHLEQQACTLGIFRAQRK